MTITTATRMAPGAVAAFTKQASQARIAKAAVTNRLSFDSFRAKFVVKIVAGIVMAGNQAPAATMTPPSPPPSHNY